MAAFEAVRPLGAAAASIDACAGAAIRIEDVLHAPPAVADPAAPVDLPPTAPSSCAACAFATATAARGCSTAPTCASSRAGRWRSSAPAAAARRRSPSCWCASATPSPGTSRSAASRPRRGAGRPARGRLPRRAGRPPVRRHARARTSRWRGPARRRARARARAGARSASGRGSHRCPTACRPTVGEHGAKVSGGQRRRIAAARLLLSPARFLIADEPAAHLDADGAAALHRRARPRGARGARRARHRPRAIRPGVLRQSVHLARRAARLG